MIDWQAIKPPIHAIPVVPVSLILAGLLLLVWVFGYFIWDYWQFSSVRQSSSILHHLKSDTITSYDFATMANGEAINFHEAFLHQQCVSVHAKNIDSQTVNVLQLCRNSVNVEVNAPQK